MKVFKFICLNATTADLQTLSEHLNAAYEILQPAFQQYDSQDYICLAWESFYQMCNMVDAELDFRTKAHERAKFIADSLLDEDANRKEEAASPTQ